MRFDTRYRGEIGGLAAFVGLLAFDGAFDGCCVTFARREEYASEEYGEVHTSIDLLVPGSEEDGMVGRAERLREGTVTKGSKDDAAGLFECNPRGVMGDARFGVRPV